LMVSVEMPRPDIPVEVDREKAPPMSGGGPKKRCAEPVTWPLDKAVSGEMERAVGMMNPGEKPGNAPAKNRFEDDLPGAPAHLNPSWNTSRRMTSRGDLGPYLSRSRFQRRRRDREAERALILGLIWLKNHQDWEGMWSCDEFWVNCPKGRCTRGVASRDYDVGCTALALLAFLRAGWNQDYSGKRGEPARKAIQILRDRQTTDGCFRSWPQSEKWIYNHAIATRAMAEAYATSRGTFRDINLLRKSAQRGIDFLVKCQNPGSGWGYGVRTGESNSSVTAWAVLALKTAEHARLRFPRSAFDGALKWFDSVTDPYYFRVGYTQIGDYGMPISQCRRYQPQETMTAASIISRLSVNNRPNKGPGYQKIIRGIQLLNKNLPKWDVKAGTIDMYHWYFGTLVMQRVGGLSRVAWNDRVKAALIPNQNRQGCESGSWDPVGSWGNCGGRVYATAINCLTLEAITRPESWPCWYSRRK
jgi:hypothetical protein